MFEKLKEAYGKARYSKHYRISEEELICSERLAELENAARAAGQRWIIGPLWKGHSSA